jgi:hypothetical protein
MPIFKYLTTEIACIVLDGSIRFTQPGAFNDPFELIPELYFPKEMGPQDFDFRFDVSAPRRSSNEADLDEEFSHDYCHDVASRKILDELNKSIGILCLSKNESSLLMWAHYAKNYSGVVIEFNEGHPFFKNIFDVEYRKIRPKKNISYYLDAKTPIPIAELCVKPETWQYESECRLVSSLKNCKKIKEKKNKAGGFPIYVMDIPTEAIKAVTMGERMSIDDQRKIWRKIKDTNITLSLAAISNNGYTFRNDLVKLNVPHSKRLPILNPRTAHIFCNLDNSFGDAARAMIKTHPLSKIVNQTV